MRRTSRTTRAGAVYPVAWPFFVPASLVTTFVVVNLVVDRVVTSMQDARHAEADR